MSRSMWQRLGYGEEKTQARLLVLSDWMFALWAALDMNFSPDPQSLGIFIRVGGDEQTTFSQKPSLQSQFKLKAYKTEHVCVCVLHVSHILS